MDLTANQAALTALAEQLGAALLARGLSLSLAESCTGGLCAEILTRVPGSSAWFDCAIVSYSNAAKIKLLHVPSDTINSKGAVSEATALAMAKGALAISGSHLSAAVTGIAGPGGGTGAKPVGTVCFAWVGQNQAPISTTAHFTGSRQEIRQQSAKTLIEGLIALTLRLDL